MKRSTPQGLCFVALVFALAMAPSTSFAATVNGSLDIQAQVGQVLSITTFTPANPVVNAIGVGDVNVGSVTIVSNFTGGFDLTVTSVNPGSVLLDGVGGQIPYTYMLQYAYGVLGMDLPIPLGPFGVVGIAVADVGVPLGFRTNYVSPTNVTYDVQLQMDMSASPANGLYTDQIQFVLMDN